MKKKTSVGGYFFQKNEGCLLYKSANELRWSILLLFYVLSGSLLLAEIANVFKGFPSPLERFSKGELGLEYMIFIGPLLFLLGLWLFLPAVKVELDREKGLVHIQKGKQQLEFPWKQVTFNHNWFPTKTGGSTLFTLVVLPPYPDALMKKVEKKGPLPPGQVFTFKLGSFDVKGPEHGQAIFGFLDAWMKSRESAESIYASKVASRFGA